MEKVLTVVVPTYNMEKYLDRCMASLIVEESLMDELEVIVVNDGSKDNSSQIAHSYETRYPQTFIVVDKENGNYGSCVNKGLELATGKYFRILDADDWFDTTSLQKFIVLLRTTKSDVVVTQFNSYYPNDEVVVSRYKHPKDFYRQYYLADFSLYPEEWLRMHQVTYRTEVLHLVGLKLQSGISYTDTEYCYFPMKSAQTVVFTDINLYQYSASREGQSMSPSNRIRSLSHMEKIAVRLVNDYEQNKSNTNRCYLRLSVYSVLLTFYGTAILDCPFSRETILALRRMDNLLRSNTELYNMTLSFSSEDFHFVAFWRRWGITKTCPIYKLYKNLKCHNR